MEEQPAIPIGAEGSGDPHRHDAAKHRPPFREHAPMHKLLSKIPQRVHRGVVGYDLNLTCLAAHPRFLALGANAGLVYWYDRREDRLSRLWCADRRDPVRKVALVETVDLMVAAGSEAGVITVFQIPAPVDNPLFAGHNPEEQHGDLSAESGPPPGASDGSPAPICPGPPPPGAEMYTVPGSHRRPVTALEWSQNGMRLFSGDEEGQIFVTEVDFVSSSTSSRPLPVANDSPVVQLSYFRQNLLVSTAERSFVVAASAITNAAEEGGGRKSVLSAAQVGSRPRAREGRYGGIFLKRAEHNSKLEMAVSRPKNALYLASSVPPSDVTVDATVLLGSQLRRPHPEVAVLNPAIFSREERDADSKEESGGEEEDGLGMLSAMCDNDGGDGEFCVVAYNNAVLHILRPKVPAVVASCSGLRKITDLSVTSQSGAKAADPKLRKASSEKFFDEIFVLEGPRSVVRLSRQPDRFQTLEDNRLLVESGANTLGEDAPEGQGLETVSSGLISMSESVVSRIPELGSAASEALGPILAAAAGGIGGKLGFAASAFAPSSSAAAREGQEEKKGKSRGGSPGRDALEPSSSREEARIEAFRGITASKEEEEEPLLDKRKSSPKKNGSKKLGELDSTTSALAIESPQEEFGGNMQKSLCNLRLELVSPEGGGAAEGEEPSSPRRDDSMEEKEAALVKALSLADFLPGARKKKQAAKETKTENKSPSPPPPESDTTAESSKGEEQKVEKKEISEAPRKRRDDEESSSVSSMSLVYGPPSDASLLSQRSQQQQQQQQQPPPSQQQQASFHAAETLPRDMTVTASKFEFSPPCEWSTVDLPCARMSSFFAHLGRIFVLDAGGPDRVFTGTMELGKDADKVTWRNVQFRADSVRCSPCGRIFWRRHRTAVFALKNFNNVDSWFEVAQGVREFDVNDWSGIILKEDGEIVMQKDLGPARPFSDKLEVLTHEDRLRSLTLANGLLLALKEDSGALVGRVGVSKTNQSGNAWVEVASAAHLRFSSVCASAQLVGTRMVHRVVGVTRGAQELVYAHGLQDDIFFDRDLQWNYISLKGVTNAENALVARLSEDLLLVGSPLLPHLLCCSRSFSASRWRTLALSPRSSSSSSSANGGNGSAWRAKHLSAGGLYRHEGVLWLVSFSPVRPGVNELYYCKFHDRKLHEVKLPTRLRSPLSCVAAAPEALWILTATGDVFARTGVTATCPQGDGGWRQVDLSQLKREGAARLRSLSLGSDCAWAADECGRAWMRLGPHDADAGGAGAAAGGPTPVWISVDAKSPGSDGPDNESPKLFRVAASASIHIVWAVDESGGVFVRDGIFPDFRLGVGWVPVPGPEDGGEEVVSVSAGESAVWVLTRGGRAFARAGITATNFIGDYWRPVPAPSAASSQAPPSARDGTDAASSGCLSLLSSSACDGAFGADSTGAPVELVEESVSLSVPRVDGAGVSPPKIADESVEGGWAVIV